MLSLHALTLRRRAAASSPRLRRLRVLLGVIGDAGSDMGDMGDIGAVEVLRCAVFIISWYVGALLRIGVGADFCESESVAVGSSRTCSM